MLKNILISIGGLCVGVGLALLVVLYLPVLSFSPQVPKVQIAGPRQVIGFLPYWLLDKAQSDYSKYITTLTYFALRIDTDGSIVKLTTPTSSEPGWYGLESGKVDPFLQEAKKNNLTLSLAFDSGDITAINSFVATPISSAHNLVVNFLPLAQKYGFSDLNLDVEYTTTASTEASTHFTQFIQEVKKELPKQMTLTVEIATIDPIQHNRLINVEQVAKYADNVVLMAYDYHSPDSLVTGPNAPLNGAGTIAEYDVTSAVEKTLADVPSQKLIVGVPLYGYEWETLGTVPRFVDIPNSGVLASNNRVEDFLTTCATCSATIDHNAQESYVSFFSDDTNTEHLIFFPTEKSTEVKLDLAKKIGLGGVALWALGYEGKDILTPLTAYKNN